MDDFKEEIPISSDDEDNQDENVNYDPKGRLTREMVENMNFGGGDEQ